MSWIWIALGLLLVALLAGAAWVAYSLGLWKTRDEDEEPLRPDLDAPWRSVPPPRFRVPFLEKKPPKKRKKRRAARPRTSPQHGVVLAHGLFGFDELRLPGARVEYWKGIPAALRKMGVEVAVPRFRPTASVATRARQLAKVIQKMPVEKVNVIAHSMGGVDARVAIARQGIANRVASVVTVATPHYGTPLANLGSFALSPFSKERGRNAPTSQSGALRKSTRPALAADGAKPARAARMPARPRIDIGGIRDARPGAMRKLNRRILDDAGVHYASVVTAAEGVGRVNPLLVPGYLFLSGMSGRNDGVVPEASQVWGDVLARVEADHWAVVGWSKGFDAPDFYESILRELAARGF